MIVVALVLLIVCAGGGYAVTTGVTWAADKLSEIATPPWLAKTKDPGVERLTVQATHTEGALTIVVQSVRVNDVATIVKVNAKNTGDETLTLPASQDVQLTLPGRTLRCDPLSSDNVVVAGHGESFSTVVFDGALPAGPAQAVLTFPHVFSLTGPQSFSITLSIG
jgi:hypothetical protein